MSQLRGRGEKLALQNRLSCLPAPHIVTSELDSIEINVRQFQWWPLEMELMEQGKKIVTTF